jgi:hypothetical protein
MRYLWKDPERAPLDNDFSSDRSIFSSHQLKVCHPLSVDAIGLLDVEREAAAPALEKLAVPTVEVRHQTFGTRGDLPSSRITISIHLYRY